MSHTFTTFEDGRIILITQGADYRYKSEMYPVLETTLVLLDQAPSPVIVLVDAHAQQSIHFDDVMAAGSLARSEDGKAVIHHPKLLKIVLVSEDRVAQLTMKGINTATFGFVAVSIFATLDDALIYSKTLLAEG
jgi:hypothetical protein